MSDLDSPTYIMGVDPGCKGAIGFLSWDGSEAWTIRLSKFTLHEIAHEIRQHRILRALVEKVHSTPQMGVSSAFTFGLGYGLIRGLLSGLEIPIDDVSPQAWRKAVGLPTVGKGLQKGSAERKRASKAKSQAMFPSWKFLNDDCDCLLIAEYGRRQFVSAAGGTQP